MALKNAHEGYEYQDLITCYFILDEILNENVSEFVIDSKEFVEDKIDDLTVYSKNRKFKKQIKYSNPDVDHRLEKKDLASNSVYNLSLDSLYQTWLKSADTNRTEFRICLSWSPPTGTLRDILKEEPEQGSFNSFNTIVYKVDGCKLWPENAKPLASWRRFRTASENIDRKKFLLFCEALLIEVLMPKISLNLRFPGELETLVLRQAITLGIGIFPNEQYRPETFILSLLEIIKRARSKSERITTNEIFHNLNIVTDYGSIEQEFPIVQNENIRRQFISEQFIKDLSTENKILVLGEPGSGKSWFLQNLTDFLSSLNIKVVRHLCYTKLDDIFQKDRIKLNVFYGNLISDLISADPGLAQYKNQKYASTLTELNSILSNIKEPTYLFIDGLDHIERIAAFRKFDDISSKDIAIIENIAKLEISPNVKIIVTSQNIEKLKLIKDFHITTIPTWNEDDVKRLMTRRKLKNKILKKGIALSDFLIAKSNGNPLYLKYIIDDLLTRKEISLSDLDRLPDYSFNLKEYYKYLLTQLNTREDVPQILSGVGFSLSKIELEEITGAGDFVSESLKILAPILTINIAHSGYRIYHESFRRFIFDHLQSQSLSVEKKIFKPIEDWFNEKDFYKYRKCFNYHLQFLYEGGKYNKVLEKLSLTYVTDSILNGYSWELIEKNYRYFVKSAAYEKDFKNIILLNEIDKIISSCREEFENIFPLYLETLGKIYGYSTVSEYLLYDGEPTMDLQLGLKACYICDQNDVAAPWNIYMDGYTAKDDDLKYFLRGLLVLKDEKKINKIAKKITRNYQGKFEQVFQHECMNFPNEKFVNRLAEDYPAIKKVLTFKKVEQKQLSAENIINLAHQITKFDSIHSKEKDIILQFFCGYNALIDDENLQDILIDTLKGKNWFYNWLIFNLKILKLDINSTYEHVKGAFQYLIYNTEPFRGNPRTTDIYSIEIYIFNSFRNGLKLIKTETEWNEIIDILTEVSENTTASIQRSVLGPLTTDKLFELLTEFACPENISKIKEVSEKLVHEQSNYRLHINIAEYQLRLAYLFAIADKKNEAIIYFEKAIQFSLAYTMRKDLSLMDVIKGMRDYALISPHKIDQTLRLSKILVESVIQHTDGKSTQHFPVMWFESFIEIDLKKSMLYLLKKLAKSLYDWRLEESLVELLIKINGSCNPVVEAFIVFTLPLQDSEKFIKYCLNLYKFLKLSDPAVAEKLSVRIISAMQSQKDRKLSAGLITEYNELFSETDTILKVQSDSKPINFRPNKRKNSSQSKAYFSSMSEDDILAYVEMDNVLENDFLSLTYIVDNFDDVNDFVKKFIYSLVRKNSSRIYDKLSLDELFSTGNIVECYYWVCRYVCDRGNWYEMFINKQAFENAYRIDQDAAFNYLFDLLPNYLEVGFNNEFSSNLISLLISLNYDPATIEHMWQNLIKMSSYRLPVQKDLDWQAEIEDNLEMNEEELLIAILISRYSAATRDRFRWVTSGIDYIFERSSEKLIKPIKWFFDKQQEFPNAAEVIILQYIQEQKEREKNFHNNFKELLVKKFPTRYFIKDYIIADLYGLKLSPIVLNNQITYSQASSEYYDFFMHFNQRHSLLEQVGVDLQHCFSRYMSTYNEIYKDHFENYGNVVYRWVVPHIWSSEHMLNIINEDSYEQLKTADNHLFKGFLHNAVHLHKDAILAYANSLGRRPQDLLLPHLHETEKLDEIIDENTEWIRIAHFEKELKKENYSDITQYKSYGAVVFHQIEENKIPYMNVSFLPNCLWSGNLSLTVSPKVIVAIFQDDPLEYYKFLWLNPSIINMMGLQTQIIDKGLVAVNLDGEVMVQMRSWSCQFISESFNTRLDDEIPMHEGTELLIKNSCFQMLKKYFSHGPFYQTTCGF